MYAHIKTDRGEVKALSPLPINTIWSVLNASEHGKKNKKRQTERERDCQESYTQLSEYHRFYFKHHQNDNRYIKNVIC
jgi:hypothetical protein